MIQGKGQGQKEKDKKEEPKGEAKGEGRDKDSDGKEKPAPLFGGKMSLKSSRQSSDQATLGFNGIEPDGSVSKDVMARQVSAEDLKKAKQLSTYAVDSGELDYFLEEGKLNKQAPAKKGSRQRSSKQEVAVNRAPGGQADGEGQ